MPSRHHSFIWPNNHSVVCVHAYAYVCNNAGCMSVHLYVKYAKVRRKTKARKNNSRAPLSGQIFNYTLDRSGYGGQSQTRGTKSCARAKFQCFTYIATFILTDIWKKSPDTGCVKGSAYKREDAQLPRPHTQSCSQGSMSASASQWLGRVSTRPILALHKQDVLCQNSHQTRLHWRALKGESFLWSERAAETKGGKRRFGAINNFWMNWWYNKLHLKSCHSCARFCYLKCVKFLIYMH